VSGDAVEVGAVEVDGLRIGYRRAGEGPPLLLLHGGVCDGRVWRRTMEQLANQFTVVAWDAPGCGPSADPPESFSLADYADCAAGLVAALGMGRPHVVGHSFGGGLAIELFHRHPSVPRSLVLVGAYAGWAGSLPPEEVAARLASFRAFEEPFVPRSFPGLFSDAMPAEAAEELTRIMEDVRLAPSRTMIRAFAEADLRPALAGIDVPTLLLYGADDVRAPRFVADHLLANIPGSTLCVLPSIGHEVFHESPAAFVGMLRPFLHSVG
jgi:pimeloyl-ACP methyl ester carboxylesterase